MSLKAVSAPGMIQRGSMAANKLGNPLSQSYQSALFHKSWFSSSGLLVYTVSKDGIIIIIIFITIIRVKTLLLL